MYHLKKAVELPKKLDLPECMYKLHPVYLTPDDIGQQYYGTDATPADVIDSGKLVAVEERQLKILKTLQELKETLDIFQKKEGLTDTDTVNSGVVESLTTQSLKQNETECSVTPPAPPVMSLTSPIHLVVSCGCKKPPYSLLLLQTLLRQEGVPVCIKSHVHCTASQVDKKLLSAFQSYIDDPKENCIEFLVHWKDQVFTSLMVNPLHQHTAIKGEANLIRYVSRILPSTSLNYETNGSIAYVAEVDYWLDTLQVALQSSAPNKEVIVILKQANQILGRQPFLTSSHISIVDVMLYSTLLQLNMCSSLPPNVLKWFTLCSQLHDPIDVVNDNLKCTFKAEKSMTTKTKSNENLKPAEKMHDPRPDPKPKHDPSKTPKDKTKIPEKAVSGLIHCDRADLEKTLKSLGIHYECLEHEEVFTVEALMKCVSTANMGGLHMKNLFLKDKKGNFYLLSARHDATIRLNDIAKKIKTKELRFGPEEIMYDLLGVRQGCVTIYSLINDTNHKVQLLLDSEALNYKHTMVNFHPMVNSATLGMSPKDLEKFLQHTGHKPTLLQV